MADGAKRCPMLSNEQVLAASQLADLPPVESDSLLKLIDLARADKRPEKIDVGVGVYRDGIGRTPIMRAVKAAEKRLWETQESKSYIGGAGDTLFPELLRPIVLGEHAADDRIAGLQTPGGCGALRLGFQLVAATNPRARVILGTPTWPNHRPIVHGVALEPVEYPYYDRASHNIRFDVMMAAVEGGRAGDVVLLHGCCHNPTGADLDAGQWAEITRIVVQRGLLPFIDIAYQGLGRGLDGDAAGLRGILAACDEVLIGQSCDKNFGVYRDRVGALFIKTARREATANAVGHVLQLAREMWSMPPDHGAAVVRIVLEDEALITEWRTELDSMRERIAYVRGRIASADSRLAYIAEQFGMFSMLPFTVEQVVKLREDHAIYMADSGRFNVVGMADDRIDDFVTAIVGAIDG